MSYLRSQSGASLGLVFAVVGLVGPWAVAGPDGTTEPVVEKAWAYIRMHLQFLDGHHRGLDVVAQEGLQLPSHPGLCGTTPTNIVN